MRELHFPALELSIVLPLIGMLWIAREPNGVTARRRSLVFFCATLVMAAAAAWDFSTLKTFEAHDRWDLVSSVLGSDAIIIDELSAPLIPLAALLYLVAGLATLRTQVARVSFSRMLLSESILLATLSCKEPGGIIALLAVGTLPPLLELRERQKSTRLYVLHMGLFLALLALGWWGVDSALPEAPPLWSLICLATAILIRSGCIPVHCWMTDLFEKATFVTALLFVAPMIGAYAAMRLLVPVSPDWVLRTVALVSLVTAVYASGMSLVQKEARRFFCYLFLSHASLVLVGLELTTTEGLAGGLSVWLSVGLALGGFGLTLRAMEARLGRISLVNYRGLYEHMPVLAGFFLLTGLASVGFPGTVGFIATELLIDGAIQVYPYSGMTIVLATALNGIAVLAVYFKIFTGAKHTATVSLRIRPAERLAVLALSALILSGGLYPHPGIASRHHAAVSLLNERFEKLSSPSVPPQNPDGHHPAKAETQAQADPGLVPAVER